MHRSILCTIALSCCAARAAAHDGHEHAALLARRASDLVAAHARHPGVPVQRLSFPWEDPQRTTVDFFPRQAREERPGVTIAAMSFEQKRSLHALLRASLGEEGALRVQAIRSLEDVLRGLAREPSGLRLPDDYAVQVFGTPGGEHPWAWKFEGHHVSIQMTVRGAEMRPTPLFLGSNPAEVRTGPLAGLRVLAALEDGGRALLAALDDEQRAQARSAATHQEDWIRRGALRAVPAPAGLSAMEMTDAQRALVHSLVASWAANLHPVLAADELRRFEAAGFERVHFLWEGSADPTQRGAYRVHGPTVFLELETLVDDPQQGANHVHAQWRDPARDFGRDLLHEHREGEHGRDRDR